MDVALSRLILKVQLKFCISLETFCQIAILKSGKQIIIGISLAIHV